MLGDLYSNSDYVQTWMSPLLNMNLIIPNGVESFSLEGTDWGWRFRDLPLLKTVSLPNTLTTLGQYAFTCCSGLTRLTIPNTVVNIGSNALDYCNFVSLSSPIRSGFCFKANSVEEFTITEGGYLDGSVFIHTTINTLKVDSKDFADLLFNGDFLPDELGQTQYIYIATKLYDGELPESIICLDGSEKTFKFEYKGVTADGYAKYQTVGYID